MKIAHKHTQRNTYFCKAKCINGEKLLFKDIFLVTFLTKLLKEILNDDKFTDRGEIQTSGLKN